MRIVKMIGVEKFRKMSNLSIPLDAYIVVVAGQNGTQNRQSGRMACCGKGDTTSGALPYY